MEIRELVPGYAVSPQIEPEDMTALAQAGFATVICNRPDGENPPARGAQAMRQAAEAAGLRFVFLPFTAATLTPATVAAQRQTIDDSAGPVFAYCASGNRCSIVWALAMAGRHPADALIGAAARWGYRLEGLRPQLEALAKG
jgi:uncharacterized protein (TIGR01244 family)